MPGYIRLRRLCAADPCIVGLYKEGFQVARPPHGVVLLQVVEAPAYSALHIGPLAEAWSEAVQVASWWDYGYQTTAMANRTVIVDNNTWNNTHIATVGRAMSSPERKAWKIYRDLDVEYVFVLFGAVIGCAPLLI